jgi:hypothetical protein
LVFLSGFRGDFFERGVKGVRVVREFREFKEFSGLYLYHT